MASDERLGGQNPEAATGKQLGAQALPAAVAKPGLTAYHRIMVGPNYYMTNLPKGLYPFESPMNHVDGDPLVYSELQPEALDEMPFGHYAVFESPETKRFGPDEPEEFHHRILHIFRGQLGKVVSIDSFGASDEELMPTVDDVFDAAVVQLMGGIVRSVRGEGQLIALPTPKTLAQNVGEQGIEVKIFPEQLTLNPTVYLTHLRDRKYAMPIGDQWAFIRTMTDPILRTMLAGSDVANDAIRDAASDILVMTEDNPRQSAEYRNDLTDYCDAVYAAGKEVSNKAERQRFMDTAQRAGFSIGLSMRHTSEIIDSLGIQVQALEASS